MAIIDELRALANQVKSAVEIGENTAERVGTALLKAADAIADVLRLTEEELSSLCSKTEVYAELDKKADRADTYTKSDLFNRGQCSHFEFGVINIGGPGDKFYWHGQTVYYDGFTSCDYQAGYGEQDIELWICFAHYEREHYVVLRCELIRGSFNQYKIIEKVTDQERIDKWFGRTIATQEENGLMSAEDKQTLDNLKQQFTVFEIVAIEHEDYIEIESNKFNKDTVVADIVADRPVFASLCIVDDVYHGYDKRGLFPIFGEFIQETDTIKGIRVSPPEKFWNHSLLWEPTTNDWVLDD